MADATDSIVKKIEALAKIKIELRNAIIDAGGELSETAPFDEYPGAISTIKNAQFKIIDKTLVIDSNGTFYAKDDSFWGLMEHIPENNRGWSKVEVNVKSDSSGGSGGSGGSSGGSGGSGGSSGGSGSDNDYSGEETVPKIAVFFKVKDSEKDSKYEYDFEPVTVDWGKSVDPKDAPKPKRTDYKHTGWNPDPVGVGVSIKMTEWDETDPNYIEGTDGYIVCYATWQNLTGEIEQDWDYIGTHSHEFAVGMYKTLNVGKRMCMDQKIGDYDNGTWTPGKKVTGHSTWTVGAGSTKVIKICDRDSNGYSVWLPENSLGYYPIKKCAVGTVSDPYINDGELVGVNNYGDTDICNYMNTTILKSFDDLLQPHIVAVTKKQAGYQSKSGAKGLITASGLKLWPLSISEYRQTKNDPETSFDTYSNIPNMVYTLGGGGASNFLLRSMSGPDTFNAIYYMSGQNTTVNVLSSIWCHGVFCLK